MYKGKTNKNLVFKNRFFFSRQKWFICANNNLQLRKSLVGQKKFWNILNNFLNNNADASFLNKNNFINNNINIDIYTKSNSDDNTTGKDNNNLFENDFKINI